jgi:plasmid maintenance system antidote protein VapI
MLELDRLSGLGEGHVAQIVSEEKNLSWPTASKLSSVLGCQPEWLLSGRGKRPSDAAMLDSVRAARAAYLRTRKVTRSVAVRRRSA